MTTPCGQRPGGYDEAVSSNSHLACFLYLLMRDDVVPGRIEKLVHEACNCDPPIRFSNDFLAAYAIELASRLSGVDDEAALKMARNELFTLERSQ